jgi:hypothetical protein
MPTSEKREARRETRDARRIPHSRKGVAVLISNEMKTALTEQIGHEFAAMLQYVTIAT